MISPKENLDGSTLARMRIQAASVNINNHLLIHNVPGKHFALIIYSYSLVHTDVARITEISLHNCYSILYKTFLV